MSIAPTLQDRIAEFFALREKQAEQEAALKATKEQIADLEPILAEEMGAAGIHNMKTDRGTLYKAIELQVSVPRAVQSKLVAACEELGLDLAEYSVSTQRLKSWIREEIGEERDYTRLPNAVRVLAKIHEAVKLRVRKS